ncbi:MAG: hypothetical protein IKU37_07790 [Candidatus Gastranaerophilales bacterium]|nr:hypothetical protein [Candidatus Gastranaerophilales bacterium]
MSSEVTTATQRTNMFSGIGASLTLSAAMTGGFGSISSIKRNGFKGAIDAAKKNNDAVRAVFKDGANAADVFTRGIATAQNYEQISDARKAFEKLKKFENGDKITCWQKIKKIFTQKDYEKINQTMFNEAKEKLTNAAGNGVEDLLKKGTDVSGVVAKGFKGNMTSLLKNEASQKSNFVFAGLEIISRFTSEALPTFKNEGFMAGMKATGKAVLAGVASWAGDVGLSLVFRTVGATIGSFFGPLGAKIGDTIGTLAGGVVSNNLVQKIFPTKEQAQELASEAPQEIQQAQPQIAQQAQTQVATNPIQQQDLSAKYANMPSKEQVKQMAYAQAFQGKGGRFNTYYA